MKWVEFSLHNLDYCNHKLQFISKIEQNKEKKVLNKNSTAFNTDKNRQFFGLIEKICSSFWQLKISKFSCLFCSRFSSIFGHSMTPINCTFYLPFWASFSCGSCTSSSFSTALWTPSSTHSSVSPSRRLSESQFLKVSPNFGSDAPDPRDPRRLKWLMPTPIKIAKLEKTTNIQYPKYRFPIKACTNFETKNVIGQINHEV